MTDDSRVSGRTAVVSGAGNGLGRAIARELAGRGAVPILVGRDAGKLSRVRDEIVASGRPAVIAPCDVSDEASVAAMRAALSDQDVSILINNAGVAGPVAALPDVQVPIGTRSSPSTYGACS